MTRSIVITSGKGGVGKTTLTANLGRALGLMGFNVLLVDTDFGLNNLDVALSVEGKVVFDIVDVIENRCRLRQALVKDEVAGVYILPSAHTFDQSKISAEALKKLVTGAHGFDFCLVDCPAGIELGFHRAVSACSEALVVTTPHLSALKDAGKVVAILRTYGLSPRLVLNRVRGDLVLREDMASAEEIRQILGAPLIGVIPDSDAVAISCNTGERLVKSNSAYKAMGLLAKNLAHGGEVLFDATKEYRGILGRLKRFRARRG